MWWSALSFDVVSAVETVRHVDGGRVHRFQVVRERDPDGDVEEWIVVGFDDDAVRLADPAFDWTREVPLAAFRERRVVPLVAGGVPVWGY